MSLWLTRSMPSSRRENSKPFWTQSTQLLKTYLDCNYSSINFLWRLIAQDQEKAIALSTPQKYTCAWRSFHQFRFLFNLKFSPNVKTLCFYISISSRSISPKYIYQALLTLSNLVLPKLYVKPVTLLFDEPSKVVKNNSHNPLFAKILWIFDFSNTQFLR